MKKTRRGYDQEFKISVVVKLESGKSAAQITREYGIHPGLEKLDKLLSQRFLTRPKIRE